MYRPIRLALLMSTLAAGILVMSPAEAVPSFARQTGMTCSACHQNGHFPELNAFGRQFKLGGYTLTTYKNIESGGTKDKQGNSDNPRLSLIDLPTLSAMFQTSMTHTRKGQPGVQNNSTAMPQQLSLFLAGRVSPHLGTFIQATYAQGDSGFSLDLADLRYANHTTVSDNSLSYGVTVNNMPTLEDPWNSTPVWGYPWSSSEQAPGPEATTMLDGDVLGDVAGLGTYGFLNGHWYGDLSLYRSSGTNVGAASGQPPSENVIKGAAPYWRLAYETRLAGANVMVGTYGMDADLYQSGISGSTNSYRDIALDTQIEKPLGEDALTVHGSLIDERREPAGASSVTYKHYKLDGNYHFATDTRATLGYDSIDTGSDNLDSTAWIAQFAYYPWLNVNLSLQYKAYTKFDGATSNASDNNTTYLMAWLVF